MQRFKEQLESEGFGTKKVGTLELDTREQV